MCGAGIGGVIAETFAAAGSAVVVSDLRMDSSGEIVDRIRTAGGKAIPQTCDVTREDDLEALVAAAAKFYGETTILVNNAGGGGPKPFDMAIKDFRFAYELNVFAGFRSTQLVAPHMKAAGGGVVLNISSMAGETESVSMASYASSKAAVNHPTRNIRLRFGSNGHQGQCHRARRNQAHALARQTFQPALSKAARSTLTAASPFLILRRQAASVVRITQPRRSSENSLRRSVCLGFPVSAAAGDAVTGSSRVWLAQPILAPAFRRARKNLSLTNSITSISSRSPNACKQSMRLLDHELRKMISQGPLLVGPRQICVKGAHRRFSFYCRSDSAYRFPQTLLKRGS